MNLAQFRESRRVLSIAQAQSELQHLAGLWLDDFDSAVIYADGFYILQHGDTYFLEIEREEYHSSDLASLESILHKWAFE